MQDYYQLDAEGEDLLRRHADWWQRRGMLYVEAHSGPLGDLWLPLSDGTVATQDTDVTPDMLDVDRAVGPALEPGPLERNGDHFATTAPYGRIPWTEALLGTPIHATIQGGSMRTKAFISDWAVWEAETEHRHEGWMDLLIRLTELLVERTNGRRAPVHTLLRGPADLAEAVVGPELMSYSLYDHPDELRRFLDVATEVFIQALHAQLDRFPRLRGGYVNPFGIWAPGKVVRTQCDATAFLSANQYAEWFLPYDVRICETVDCSMIHLHSCSLHTVPKLLEVERPHAIQITLESEPSGPPLPAMIPIFQDILAVKPLLVDGPLTADEVKHLQDVLPTDGLSIRRRVES